MQGPSDERQGYRLRGILAFSKRWSEEPVLLPDFQDPEYPLRIARKVSTLPKKNLSASCSSFIAG
jgi:hypothetical protein